jgi:hypothetical protein
MRLEIGDWIILKKESTITSNYNKIGKIIDINIHQKVFIINFGKKSGNLSKKYEIFLQMEYRLATENEIKKEKIKRVFICKDGK